MKESAQPEQHNGQAHKWAEHGDGPEDHVQDQAYHQGQDPSSAPPRTDRLYEQHSGEEANNDLGQVARRDPESEDQRRFGKQTQDDYQRNQATQSQEAQNYRQQDGHQQNDSPQDREGYEAKQAPAQAGQGPVQNRVSPTADPPGRDPHQKQPHQDQRDEAAKGVQHRFGERATGGLLLLLDGTLLVDHVALDPGPGVYLRLRTGLVGEVSPDQGRIRQRQPWLYRRNRHLRHGHERRGRRSALFAIYVHVRVPADLSAQRQGVGGPREVFAHGPGQERLITGIPQGASDVALGLVL